MQVPVFIIEKREIDGEMLDVQHDLILLHWGIQATYFPIRPEEQVQIPIGVTMAICKDPLTGETFMIPPDRIIFKPDTRVEL